MSPSQVVILEDDPEVRTVLESAVDADGHGHVAFGCVRDFMDKAPLDRADLFLLDISLPDGDGLDVARHVRKSAPEAGIIMITGHHDEVDTVLAFEFGADDYVTKPFRARELRARMKSVLRRVDRVSQSEFGAVTSTAAKPVVLAGLEINQASRSVRRKTGEVLDLTTLEYDVLLALVTPPNRVLSRNQIMDRVRGPDWAAYDRTIDGIISRLRSKLFPDLSPQEVIKTIRGVGYMFANDD